MINDSNNNYGGAFSPYEDIDTPDNEDKGVLSDDDGQPITNPIDNYYLKTSTRVDVFSPNDDDNKHEKDEKLHISNLRKMMEKRNNNDISDVTDIDSRVKKPAVMNPAQKILDEKLNLCINGIRLIVDRLDKDAYEQGKQAMMNTTHPYAAEDNKHADGTINQIDVLYHNLQKANKKIKELQQKKEEI